MTNLYQAVASKNLKAVRHIFSHENVNAVDAAGALENAAEIGALNIVRFLVKQNVRHDWAVVNAARFDHVSVLRFLAENKIGNVDAALIAAAAHGNIKSTRWLVNHVDGLNLDEALADAVFKGYEDIALFLLKKGGNPNTPVYNGQTAAQIAVQRNRKKVLAVLNGKNKKPLK